MQRVTGCICAVLGRVIFIGLSIQILTGLLWMGSHLTDFQEFGESYLYLQAADSLLCDEYMGILYPLFLLLVRGMAGLFSVPYYTLVYVLQLAAACCAGYYFLQSIRETGLFLRVWGMLALLSVPPAMQCHMAVLPYSFAGTLLLLELSFLMKLLKRKKGLLFLCGIVFFYLAGIFLMPDYLIFGGIPVIIGLFYQLSVCFRYSKKGFMPLGILILCLLAAGSNYHRFATEGSYGRPRRTLPLMAASRFAGSCLEDTYGYWPEDLKACLSDEEIRRSCDHAGDVWRVFGKAAQERLGAERSDEVFAQVARAGYQVYYVRVRHDLVWDLAAYTFSPFFLQLQLEDRGYTSYSGRNYDIMRMKEPGLTKVYVDYGSWWFTAGLALMVLWQPLHWIHRKLKKTKACELRKMVLCFCCIAIGGSMILWYTLQGAGMMDYKNTVPVVLFWTAWMAGACFEVVPNRQFESEPGIALVAEKCSDMED